jgi:thiol-disulfide isomerase/thioredoxin
MKKYIYLLLIVLTFSSCKAQVEPIVFSAEALKDVFLKVDDAKITFQDILNKHKGKIVVIDVWASWCGDCLKGLPKVKTLQAQFPEADYVFLSLDKKIPSWKKGIEKHNIKGDHYYMQSGWKGAFGSFLDLDWIPRYLVVDKNQNITVFNAVSAEDKNINNALKPQ